MTTPWQAVCAHCKQRFPLEESDAHQASCEASGKSRFLADVARPHSWSYGVGVVRETVVETPAGDQKKFLIGIAENPLTRVQLVGLRDLITLALAESPEPVLVAPQPPGTAEALDPPPGTVA